MSQQSISEDVLLEKYAKVDETTAEVIFNRVAKGLASVESAELRSSMELIFLDNMNTALYRPRPFQGDQRHPGPSCRRRVADRSGAPPAGNRARQRCRRPARWRRVRDHADRHRPQLGDCPRGRKAGFQRWSFLPDRRPRPVHIAEYRYRHLSHRWRRWRDADEECRCRHVPRQDGRAEQLPVLRPENERCRHRPAEDRTQPAPGAGQRRVLPALPAGHRPGERPGVQCRGAGALAASREGLADAGAFHRHRRRDRLDPADRRVGAVGRLSPAGSLPRGRAGQLAHGDQHFRHPDAQWQSAHAGPRHHGGLRTEGRKPDVRDHRIGGDGAADRNRAHSRSVARHGNQYRHRRFRHRLFVLELPPHVPDQPPQARPLLRQRDRR